LDSERPGPHIILVHGTWGQGFDPYKLPSERPIRWFEPGHAFHDQLVASLDGEIDPSDVSAFLWSGANSMRERAEAAAALTAELDQRLILAPDAEQIVIAHSHGGNVALRARDAMTGDKSRVQIITLATPFIRMTRRALSLADRMLAIGLFAATLLAGIASFLASFKLLSAWDALDIFPAYFCIGPLSLMWACLTLGRRVRDRILGPNYEVAPSRIGPLARANVYAAVANVVVLILFAAVFGLAGILIADGTVVPSICVVALLLALTRRMAFDRTASDDRAFEDVGRLAILRSHRDEASLALAVGKITSSLSYGIGIFSIVTPALVATAASPLLVIAATRIFEGYKANQTCRETGDGCLFDFKGVYDSSMATGRVWEPIVIFSLVGLLACMFLIVLMTLSKATFGRELLWRSVNLNVDVHDTPDGRRELPVSWCLPARGQLFGLRHSLYESPDAIAKIIDTIRGILCGAEDARPAASATGRSLARGKRTKQVAVGLSAAALYLGALAFAYAPVGAPNLACRLRSLDEPGNPDNKLTALVAALEGDDGSGAEWLARELRERLGLHAVRTCMQVVGSGYNSGPLMASRNADFVIWGRRVGSKLYLQFDAKRAPADYDSKSPPATARLNDPFWTALRNAVIKVVEDAGRAEGAVGDEKKVAQYSNQIGLIVSKIEPDIRLGADSETNWLILHHWIRLEAAAGMWANEAAKESRDPILARRSVRSFERAIAMRDAHEKGGEFSTSEWMRIYYQALVLDAELNRDEQPAKTATRHYIDKYDEWRHSAVPASTLYQSGDEAAHALAVQASITHDRNTARLRDQMACETLAWVREGNSNIPELREKFRRMHDKGGWLGAIVVPPEASSFFAYAILKRRPGVIDQIFAPAREDPVAFCKTL
jgi:hypothetical protein